MGLGVGVGMGVGVEGGGFWVLLLGVLAGGLLQGVEELVLTNTVHILIHFLIVLEKARIIIRIAPALHIVALPRRRRLRILELRVREMEFPL